MTQMLIKSPAKDKAFIFVVTTDDSAFQLPIPQYLYDDVTPAVYDFYVDWGNGEPVDHITAWDQEEAEHSYFGDTGDFTVRIWGRMDLFRFAYSQSTDADMVTDFLQWGDVQMKEFLEMFSSCVNMSYSATDVPKLVTGAPEDYSLYAMFYECGELSGDASAGDFSGWDVSDITEFDYMFEDCGWDMDISAWEPIEAVDFHWFLEGADNWSDENYDLLLAAWSLLTYTNSGMDFDCEAQYTETAARAVLTGSPNNWTISDGGAA